MEKTNETVTRSNTQDDITELGVASIETMGPEPGDEFMGGDVIQGISDR